MGLNIILGLINEFWGIFGCTVLKWDTDPVHPELKPDSKTVNYQY